MKINDYKHKIKIGAAILSFIFLFSAFFNSALHSQVPPQTETENTEDEYGSYNDEFNDMLEEGGWSFNLKGHYKNLFMYQYVNNFYGTNILTTGKRHLVTDLNRVRLSPEVKYGDMLVFHIDYDNEAIFSTYNKSHEFNAYWRPANYNQFADIDWDLAHNRDIYYRMKIHRAYAKAVLGDFTITAGRQQIRFGSSKLWNPLDIFNPISPTFIEGAEDQQGTDALRIDYYFAERTELTFIYDQKRHDNDFDSITVKDSNSALRFKTALFDVDFAILGGYISRRIIAGTDISVTVLDGILRANCIYANPENGKTYVQASSGYEYTFENGITLIVEYFFNQNGINYNNTLKAAYLQSQFFGWGQSNYNELANQMLTYNQHYGGLALTNEFHPLLSGNIFTIYDFQGKGLFVNTSLKYNIIEDIDLSLGLMYAYVFGDSEASDFGMMHKQPMVYASFQYYF